MGEMTSAEIECFRTFQRDLQRFRHAHGFEMSMEDLRLINECFGSVNVLMKRYAPNALPGGF